MSLWPGYYINKFEAIHDPIISELPVLTLDAALEPDEVVKSVGGTIYNYGIHRGLRTANGRILLEQFGPGTMNWMYYFDEWHWILIGEADLEYSLASTARMEKKRAHVKPGDFFITPRGSQVAFIVPPGAILRRYCGMMPGYAMHPRQWEALKKAREQQEKAGPAGAPASPRTEGR